MRPSAFISDIGSDIKYDQLMEAEATLVRLDARAVLGRVWNQVAEQTMEIVNGSTIN